MQLRAPRLATWALVLTCVSLLSDRAARADEHTVDVGATLFHEGGGPLQMTVITPSARARVQATEELGLRLGWEADVVSGASVAVVDAPSTRPDVITSATRVEDFRNVFSGGADLRTDFATFRAGYAYGFENDYRSHALSLGARVEMFDRTAAIDLSFGRGWDATCDLAQPRVQDPVQRRRLPSSMGCFDSTVTDLTTRSLDLNSFQGSWTQAWSSVFVTQLSLSAQLVDGFQSNPYRAVWLGRNAAQEHHPDHRVRYAASLGARLWIAPLSGALQANVRAYRDSWDVMSLTGELAYEQVVEGDLRLRVRGRYYQQTAAAFFSDDYAIAPRGQYFTGDRELSEMRSVLVGAQLSFRLRDAAFFQALDIVLKGDYIRSDFESFHYGSAGVPNRDALIATLALQGEL